MKISGTNKHACSLYTEGRKKSVFSRFLYFYFWGLRSQFMRANLCLYLTPTLISLQLENTDEIKILNSGKLWGSAADSTQFSTHFNSACRTSCDLNDGLMCECLKMKQSMVYLNNWTLDVSPVNETKAKQRSGITIIIMLCPFYSPKHEEEVKKKNR